VDRAEWLQAELGGTGLAEGGNDDPLQVFPNPATDRVHLRLDGDGPMDYRLSDARGALVRQGRLTGEQATLPLTGLEAGTYVLSATRDGRTRTQRIMVR
jgi:hypothetical protein